MTLPLAGKVAVVTGASRGVGRGIALGLGEAGATVYVTGRTVEEGAAHWPGTIGATAEAVSALGGRGIAVRCDHRDDAAIAALFAQVEAEQGRLDVLVNNVYSIPGLETPGGVPFWELPLDVWDHIHTVGLRAHFVASRCAAPRMIAQGSGLIVNVSSAGGARYLFNVAYGAAKAALERLAADPEFPLSLAEMEDITAPEHFVGRAPEQVDEFLENVIEPILTLAPALPPEREALRV
jgi:dehydrogenase/reductase SDR family protein 1